MAVEIFQRGFEFSGRNLKTLGYENRVVAKTVCSGRRHRHAPRPDSGKTNLFTVANQRNRADKCRSAMFRGDVSELSEQQLAIGAVIARSRPDGRKNTGGSTHNLDGEPRVVGEAGEAGLGVSCARFDKCVL